MAGEYEKLSEMVKNVTRILFTEPKVNGAPYYVGYFFLNKIPSLQKMFQMTKKPDLMKTLFLAQFVVETDLSTRFYKFSFVFSEDNSELAKLYQEMANLLKNSNTKDLLANIQVKIKNGRERMIYILTTIVILAAYYEFYVENKSCAVLRELLKDQNPLNLLKF